MNRILKLTSSMLAVFFLNGCVVAIGNDGWGDEDHWKQRQNRNREYIDHLELGQNMASIRSDLGDPDFNESFQRNGEEFQVIYYRTRHVDNDGITTMNETTPLVFIDGVLVGWGQTAIENATR